MPIEKITDEIVQIGGDLKDVNDEKLSCLKIFIKCKALVDWLKTELKGKIYFPMNYMLSHKYFFTIHNCLLNMQIRNKKGVWVHMYVHLVV